MSKELINNSPVFWFNQICTLPYTSEEILEIGYLSYDMAHNNNFKNCYMSELQKVIEHRQQNNQTNRIAFSELNLQLYGSVLRQPDLKCIPDWITVPEKAKVAKQNPLRARIIRLRENISKNENPPIVSHIPDNPR